MTIQFHFPGHRDTLAGNIIWRRADAAEAKTQVTTLANTTKLVLELNCIIPHHVHPIELQFPLS